MHTGEPQEAAERALSFRPPPLTAYATPRAFVSAAALVCIAGLLGVCYLRGVVQMAALIIGAIGVVVASAFTAPIVLATLLLRPLLRVLPELDIAGRQIGIDGILNMMLVCSLTPVMLWRRPAPLRRAVFVVWCLFLLLMLLSLQVSSDFTFGARQWFRFYGYVVFFWMAYAAAAGDPRFVTYLRRIVVGVVLLLACMGFLQMSLLVRQVPLSEYVDMMRGHGTRYRLDGFQDYPHIFANTLLVCVPILLWSAWTTQRRAVRLAYFCLAFGSVVAIVMTGVRSAFGAFVAILVIYLIGIRGYRRLVALLVLFVAAGFATGVFQARFDDLTNPERATEWNSLIDRQEIWHVVDRGIAAAPIRGYGLGSVDAYLAESPLRQASNVVSSHCDYRKFAFEGGVAAGVLFTLLWVAVAVSAWRARKHSLSSGHLESAVAGVAVGFMVIALVDEILLDYGTMTLYWTVAGATLGMTHSTRAGEEAPGAAECVPAPVSE